MTDGVLSAFKIGLLVLIYLFFFRVLRAVWNQLKEPRVITTVATPVGPVAKPQPTRTQAAPAQAAPTTPAVVASELRLKHHGPSGIDAVVVITSETFLIGRSRQAQLVLDDSFASQRHAQLERRTQGWVVNDMGSTNGTIVNGIKIADPAPLTVGDVIAIGSHTFEVL